MLENIFINARSKTGKPDVITSTHHSSGNSQSNTIRRKVIRGILISMNSEVVMCVDLALLLVRNYHTQQTLDKATVSNSNNWTADLQDVVNEKKERTKWTLLSNLWHREMNPKENAAVSEGTKWRLSFKETGFVGREQERMSPGLSRDSMLYLANPTCCAYTQVSLRPGCELLLELSRRLWAKQRFYNTFVKKIM